MPALSLDIEKSFAGEFWTNRYILNVPSFTEGKLVKDEIVALEKAIHTTIVNFERWRLSDFDPATDAYQTGIIGGTGSRATGTNIMPGFVVVRVDFEPESGRPSRKYLRYVGTESDANTDLWTDGFVLEIFNNYANPMLAVDEYVDVDLQTFLTTVVSRKVGMRQFRRGSRRRTEPVLP